MSSVLFIPAVPAVLLVTACASLSPATSSSFAFAPAAIAAEIAEVASGTGAFDVEGDWYLNCIDEMVQESFHAPFSYRLFVNARGEATYLERFNVESAKGTVVGLTSGHTWRHTRVASPAVARNGAGGTTVYTFRSTLVSTTGPTLELRSDFSASRDVEGESRIASLRAHCVAR